MRAKNDELSWLWALTGALMMDLYPSSWVGDPTNPKPPPCGPTRLPGETWTTANDTVFLESNMRESRRLSDAQPHKPAAPPYFWWHFTGNAGNCSASASYRANKSMPYANSAGVANFFRASAKLADGAVLWGHPHLEIDVVEAQLSSWQGTVQQYCDAPSRRG